jgi:hypothetical protein
MPPSRTQINCPRCRQPIAAQIEQLFDVSADPGAKQRLLGGISNYAACPHCGYAGALATPIIYHDTDKQLLLTYFPPELGMPLNEQEKIIGPLITQVTNRLPAEKRKAYLLQPKSFLTYQSLIEHILGADGITPEMLAAQQKRMLLVEKLLAASSDDIRKEIIKQEATSLDAEFFALFNRLMEGAIASGQNQIGQQMGALQKLLLEETEYGRQISGQVKELEEAVRTLQAAGKELTREKLLDILLEAPNEERLTALVSMTRPGLDYQFFQMLSERLETKTGDERKKLESLREHLLDVTRQIDQRVEEEYKRAGDLLHSLVTAQDIAQATAEHIEEISDIFIQVLNRALQEAKKNNNEEELKKLGQIVSVLQEASTPPPEYELLQKLLEAQDDVRLDQLIQENSEKITAEFTNFIGSALAQTESRTGEQPDAETKATLERLEVIYRAVLKFSMKSKMK